MGTNYYHRSNICTCCGRYDERHICKSMLSFQGYKRPVGEDASFTEVLSWADWKQELLAGGEIWSEYGYQVDTDQFIRDVESRAVQDRRRQYDWVQENGNRYGERFRDRYWLDADGFSFYDGEFF